jgi:beta-glucosidase
MGKKYPYLDTSLPVQQRCDDLLGRMTLEEKIGQLYMHCPDSDYSFLKEKCVGTVIGKYGEEMVTIQKEVGGKNRLGIPLLFSLDCIHGHAKYPGATVFPSQLTLSCSWNPELLKRVGRVTAREMACTGVHWTFSPVLDLARDLRWGRVDETFGEDGYLAGKLGAALIRGYQGDNLSDPESVAACAKHFAGYCETLGGRDSTETVLSERALRTEIFPPYQDAVKAKCATFMAGYQAVDGVPCSANRWLLTTVLRDEMEFEGFVVSDWNNLKRLVDLYAVCSSAEDAATAALEAGNDMAMATDSFPDAAAECVRQGVLDEAVIDRCCRRILKLKFELGLFDTKRFPDLKKRKKIIACREHTDWAYESACQSIVLLKNKNMLLPLASAMKTIAVVGPNADDCIAMNGDWTLGFGAHATDDSENAGDYSGHYSLLRGIRERVGDRTTVLYDPGCSVLDPQIDSIENAKRIAQQAQFVIVAVGDTAGLVGEKHDRAVMELTGKQQMLLEAVRETGTPMIVVLIASKPLVVPWIAENADAFLAAFNPGMMGGKALAALIMGDRNPEGKLTVSFPYHIGQQPVRYNQPHGWHGPGYYRDLPSMSRDPLYPFGFGLSYTQFRYSSLRVVPETVESGGQLTIDVSIENCGDCDGVEIVQLYIRDVVASVTRPTKQLKGFTRIPCVRGEQRRITFHVDYDDLALYDAQHRWRVEPGEYEVCVGSSSREEDLVRASFSLR